MFKQISDLEKRILIGAVRDLQHLRRSGKPIPGCDRTASIFNLETAQDEARLNGMVLLDITRWLERSPETPAERMAVSRAYVSLEKRGLVNRVNARGGNDRCTHLAPTPDGIALVRTLTKPAAT